MNIKIEKHEFPCDGLTADLRGLMCGQQIFWTFPEVQLQSNAPYAKRVDRLLPFAPTAINRIAWDFPDLTAAYPETVREEYEKWKAHHRGRTYTDYVRANPELGEIKLREFKQGGIDLLATPLEVFARGEGVRKKVWLRHSDEQVAVIYDYNTFLRLRESFKRFGFTEAAAEKKVRQLSHSVEYHDDDPDRTFIFLRGIVKDRNPAWEKANQVTEILQDIKADTTTTIEHTMAILDQQQGQVASHEELHRKLDTQAVKKVDGGVQAHKGGAKFSFRDVGGHYEAVFEGRPHFTVLNTLGAKYVDYLLHRPNELIAAYDLEMAIRPEKAGARAKTSIQTKLDPDAVKDYLRELDELRADREKARADDDEAGLEQLDRAIAQIEDELEKKGQSTDAGEQARNNVRKAVTGIISTLNHGNPHQKAFAQHLSQCIKLGYKVIYSWAGDGWE